MKLLRFEGYKLVIEPELLTLKPFRKIWTRDKSPNKEKAILELGFIYHFCDPRSDYDYIMDLETRKKEIKLGEGLPESWEPDAHVKEAIEFFNSFKTISALLLEDTKLAIEQLRKGIKEMNVNKVDDKGRLVYSLPTITSTIKQIPTLVEELTKAERAVKMELLAGSRMRGAGEKTILEDDLDG